MALGRIEREFRDSIVGTDENGPAPAFETIDENHARATRSAFFAGAAMMLDTLISIPTDSDSFTNLVQEMACEITDAVNRHYATPTE